MRNQQYIKDNNNKKAINNVLTALSIPLNKNNRLDKKKNAATDVKKGHILGKTT